MNCEREDNILKQRLADADTEILQQWYLTITSYEEAISRAAEL